MEPDWIIPGRRLQTSARQGAFVRPVLPDEHPRALAAVAANLQGARYRAAVDGAGRAASSFFRTAPPFITNLTRSISVTSVSGLPATAMMSANFPFSTLPTRFAQL